MWRRRDRRVVAQAGRVSSQTVEAPRSGAHFGQRLGDGGHMLVVGATAATDHPQIGAQYSTAMAMSGQ